MLKSLNISISKIEILKEINQKESIDKFLKELKNTIKINDKLKYKLLNQENYFDNFQFQIINKNINNIDDMNLILSKTIKITFLLSNEFNNLKKYNNNDYPYKDYNNTFTILNKNSNYFSCD